MEEQQQTEKRTWISKLKSFLVQTKRVFKLTKKSTREEFMVVVKVTGIGILIIGLFGFVIHMGWALLT